MTKTIRLWTLAFVCGILLAVWLFFANQNTGYNLYASILWWPGLQQGEVTYDVALHGDDSSMRLEWHRDFSQVKDLRVLVIYDEAVSLDVLTEVDSIREEKGVLEIVLTDFSSYTVGGELLRWSYEWDQHNIVLSDVEATIEAGESELLSVFNTLICIGEECTHSHGDSPEHTHN